MKYVLAIDQSTSSTKVILFDEEARLIRRCNVDHKQIHPQTGWLEHDPVEIYKNTIAAMRDAASGIDKAQIKAVAITNQRETTMIWDADTGKPVYHAIVWQCSRAESITKRQGILDMADAIANKTGLKLSPYFSAAKACWIMENADVSDKTLMFGTMDAWLIWKLTGNHATDFSNASRTQLFNINESKWDDELVALFGLKNVQLPEVKYSDEIFGMTTADGLFDNPVPVSGVMGDSHGALFGQQCWKPGMGKCTFGTGSSVMMNIGDKPIASKNNLATSVAWGMGGKIEYVFEGNINCTGDTIRWLVNELGLLPDARMSEEYARKVASSEGVYLVPAFMGLGAPYYESNARASITGLFRDANRYHIVRAALEAIAYQIKDIVDLMHKDAGMSFEELRVDGGPTNNALLMQFVADILNLRIVKNEIEELSALGSTFAAGLATGIYRDREYLAGLRRTSGEYQRRMEETIAQGLYDGWKLAVKKTLA